MTVFAWILVVLGVLVLVLTPLRLRRSKGERGMTDFSGWVLNAQSITLFIGLGLISLRLLDVHTSAAAAWLAIICMVIASLIALPVYFAWYAWDNARRRHRGEPDVAGPAASPPPRAPRRPPAR